MSFIVVAQQIWSLIPNFFITNLAILYFNLLSVTDNWIPFYCATDQKVGMAALLLRIHIVVFLGCSLPVRPNPHWLMPLVEGALYQLGGLVHHFFAKAFPMPLSGSFLLVYVRALLPLSLLILLRDADLPRRTAFFGLLFAIVFLTFL